MSFPWIVSAASAVGRRRCSAACVAARGVLETGFTRLVGCAIPIQQAGMGGVATPELALAVTGAGALGMVTGTLVPPAALGQCSTQCGAPPAGPLA